MGCASLKPSILACLSGTKAHTHDVCNGEGAFPHIEKPIADLRSALGQMASVGASVKAVLMKIQGEARIQVSNELCPAQI